MADETKRDDAASRELAAVEAQITEVAAEVAEVSGKITRVEAALSESGAYLGITEPAQLLKRLDALEEEKKQLRQNEDRLREDKHDLRQEKRLLMPMPQPAAPDDRLDEMREQLQRLVMANEEARSMRVPDMTSATKCQPWQHAMGLELVFSQEDLGGASIEPVADFMSYTWPSGAEASSKQAYMRFMSKLFPLPPGEGWLDCSMYPQLLTVKGGTRLAFTIAGTSDVGICSASAIKSGLPSTGIRVLFELKMPGNLHGAGGWQAATDLMLANLHSPSRRPVVVLTDLGEQWTIFWIKDSTISGWNLREAEAISVIRKMLSDETVSAFGVVTWMSDVMCGTFSSLVSRSNIRQSSSRVTGDEGSLSSRLCELGLEVDDADEAVRHALVMECVREVAEVPCFAPYTGGNGDWRSLYTWTHLWTLCQLRARTRHTLHVFSSEPRSRFSIMSSHKGICLNCPTLGMDAQYALSHSVCHCSRQTVRQEAIWLTS